MDLRRPPAKDAKQITENEIELLSEMSKDLGLSKSVDQLTMDRYYQPQGLTDAEFRNSDIQSSVHLLTTAIVSEIQKRGIGAKAIVDAIAGKQPEDGVASTDSN